MVNTCAKSYENQQIDARQCGCKLLPYWCIIIIVKLSINASCMEEWTLDYRDNAFS